MESATTPKKSQADLLVEAQQRKEQQFRGGVLLSWGILLFILIYLFSGQKYLSIELNYQFMRENVLFIAGGLEETLKISIISITLAILLAITTALARLSPIPPIYAISTFYTSVIRGTPLYLQIFFFFFGLSQFGIRLTGFQAGIVALSLNYGAYMSETFRAALTSVGKGQREAAAALGMTPLQIMWRIVLPQALRFAIPPMGNDFISMTKDSALVSITGFVHEVMWRATRVGRAQFNNFEALIMAAAFYWVLTLILTFFQTRLEARLARGDR